MNLRTTTNAGRAARRSHAAARPHRSPAALRSPAAFLAVAASGALVVSVLSGGEPTAHASTTAAEPVSVARELGLTAAYSSPSVEALRSLQDLAASRSRRADGPGAAVLAEQAPGPDTLRTLAKAGQARQHALDEQKAKAAAAAAAAAAAKARAAAQAAAQAQAAQQARVAAATPTPTAAAAAVAPSGSYQDYALQKVGAGQFSCLENLWGRESGWNPNAANPSSSAYGIPQLLDSTWASTGIAKTSDGYRQIDAGLIYIDSRYGSPCGAWSHSESYGWY
jgi:hypothetical protein